MNFTVITGIVQGVLLIIVGLYVRHYARLQKAANDAFFKTLLALDATERRERDILDVVKEMQTKQQLQTAKLDSMTQQLSEMRASQKKKEENLGL